MRQSSKANSTYKTYKNTARLHYTTPSSRQGSKTKGAARCSKTMVCNTLQRLAAGSRDGETLCCAVVGFRVCPRGPAGCWVGLGRAGLACECAVGAGSVRARVGKKVGTEMGRWFAVGIQGFDAESAGLCRVGGLFLCSWSKSREGE